MSLRVEYTGKAFEGNFLLSVKVYNLISQDLLINSIKKKVLKLFLYIGYNRRNNNGKYGKKKEKKRRR